MAFVIDPGRPIPEAVRNAAEEQLLKLGASLKNTHYGRYLEAVANERRHQY